jgi:hypothetical protein
MRTRNKKARDSAAEIFGMEATLAQSAIHWDAKKCEDMAAIYQRWASDLSARAEHLKTLHLLVKPPSGERLN